MSIKSRNVLKSIDLRLKDLYSAIENSQDVVEKAKYLFLVNELTNFRDIFDEKVSDGKPVPLRATDEDLVNTIVNKIRHTLTNHPTNALGHQATVELLKMKLAIIDGNFDAVGKCMKNFMEIEEPTSKRTTSQSGYVINNFLKVRWKSYDYLSEDAQKNEYGDWLNDADGNPFKTLRVLKKELVDKNKLFQECIVDDLDKIIGAARKGNRKLMEEIKDIFNFEINENNFLKAEDVSNSLRGIANSDIVDDTTKKKLLKLSEKIDSFGTFMSKPEIRQEGEIFQKAYKLVTKRFREENRKAENYNFSLDDKGNVIATHKTEVHKKFDVFKASEYCQKTDEEGKFLPLEKDSDSIAIDHFAKLVYLKQVAEKTKVDPVIDTFIMSEFKGAMEMADTLRLFDVVGIDTQKIRLFPLYEEIDEYRDIKNTINILKKSNKHGADLSADEKLVKDYIDKAGKVFLMYAASDTTKRGGAEAYSKMLYHLTKLCDAISEYNKDLSDDKKLKLSFYWGGGPSQSRGGAINFIRALKSIAGDRGVETEISYTLQGEGINRISDPANYIAYEEHITQENKYQASRKIQSEGEYLSKKNEGIWRRISGIFNVLGNELGGSEEKFKSFYKSAYGKFSKENLTNKNPFLNLLSKLAAGVNTADRPDSRKSFEEGTPFFEMLRAIGYDLMGRQAGFNNIIVGHGKNLSKFFDELKSGNAKVGISEIKQLQSDSTVFQSQINTYAQIIGMTDFDYAEKLAGILEDNSDKYRGSRDFIKLIKQETMAMAKFTAIALGKADENTSVEDAYNTIRSEFSTHLNTKNTKIAKDLMADLFKGIAKGDIDVNNLGAYKTVVGACVDTLRSDYIMSPTLSQKREVANTIDFSSQVKMRG